ncbi:MAG: hypothetical protein II627_02870 [Lachnospiraceae bacterium]|nr:hypothetical protein [Lachnospiraceae bacterium]
MYEVSAAYHIIRETKERPDNTLSLSEMCRYAGISRSGYYSWLRAEEQRTRKEQEDIRDFQMILIAGRINGYPRGGVKGIVNTLRNMDPPVVMNHKKVSRLLEKYYDKLPPDMRKKKTGCLSAAGMT